VKTYLLFLGSRYYPMGGTRDLAGQFDTVEEAKEDLSKYDSWDWYQLVEVTPYSVKEIDSDSR
jgi:hypothetical protein